MKFSSFMLVTLNWKFLTTVPSASLLLESISSRWKSNVLRMFGSISLSIVRGNTSRLECWISIEWSYSLHAIIKKSVLSLLGWIKRTIFPASWARFFWKVQPSSRVYSKKFSMPFAKIIDLKSYDNLTIMFSVGSLKKLRSLKTFLSSLISNTQIYLLLCLLQAIWHS